MTVWESSLELLRHLFRLLAELGSKLLVSELGLTPVVMYSKDEQSGLHLLP